MFTLFLFGIGFILYGLTVALNERVPKKPVPKNPGPGLVTRNYTWSLTSLSRIMNFHTKIYIDGSLVVEARKFLFSTSPGKTDYYSDVACAYVAKKEIQHNYYGIGSYEIEQLVNYIEQEKRKYYLSEFELANLVLQFVHDPNIKYSYDKDSMGYTEYFRCPIETLWDKTGDCDCKAILAATILKKLGFDVAFLLMPGHAAVAISSKNLLPASNMVINGKRWYFCETTGSNWTAGALPGGISWREINLFEV